MGRVSLRDLPVVEDLTSQDMPPNPPAVLMPPFAQPVVPEDLRVEVVRLVGRVVDLGRRARG